MSEKDIEQYLVKRVKEDLGDRTYKLISPGNGGMPDRMVCLPGGRIVFVELKAPSKVSSPLQLLQQRRLRELGFQVWIIDSKDRVDQFIAEYMDR